MMLIMKIPIVPRNNDNFVFVLLLPQNIETRRRCRCRCCTANGDNNGWWPMVYFAYSSRRRWWSVQQVRQEISGLKIDVIDVDIVSTVDKKKWKTSSEDRYNILFDQFD